MKSFAIAMALGAAMLLGGSAANAADNSVKANASTDVTQSTDFSSRDRHGRNYRVQRIVRPNHSYRSSSGHAPRYGNRRGHGGGGPSVTIGVGGGAHSGGGGHR
ncbi:hypothetical protein HNQ36_003554 [Afipia massiliensis]|jgi:hypothetical protein|uniref:DUF4148 domain-containing protein n=1 Tax=Afipia massiliensis TaxID=211460 RepID=A0A840N4K2_9BRAD|nr:hypothetical protein [Afipia massiliensis]